jgi:hypothetical protein
LSYVEGGTVELTKPMKDSMRAKANEPENLRYSHAIVTKAVDTGDGEFDLVYIMCPSYCDAQEVNGGLAAIGDTGTLIVNLVTL